MPPVQSTRLVYVFDAAVPDLETLIGEVRSAKAEAAPFIIVLEAGSDGVLQLADALAGHSGLDAIHIFSHGAVGSLYLGSAVLDQGSLGIYENALRRIGGALGDTGDLLLYGCNVAQGELGQLFIEQLAALTGTDVAASDDPTGSSYLGGDAELEVSVGDVAMTDAIEQKLFDDAGVLLPTLTGQFLVDKALGRLGDEYYWTQRPNGTYVVADYDNPDYGPGPNGGWDCAEFVSWCVYQAYTLQIGLAGGANGDVNVTLPLFSALHRLPIMRTSCLAAGPRSSFAQTSSG